MEPNSFGRKLGIGVRIAGNLARARAAEAGRRAEVPSAPAGPTTRQVQDNLQQRSQNLGRGLGRGTKNFGKSIFGPFLHAGGVLWLEITGCFFALFAAFFAQNAFKLRAEYAAGTQHQRFVIFAVLTLVFVYFSASSFLRARRKGRRQQAGQ
jgi:hypothetical protein